RPAAAFPGAASGPGRRISYLNLGRSLIRVQLVLDLMSNCGQPGKSGCAGTRTRFNSAARIGSVPGPTRTAVVTGAASGLGQASAERLARDGVDVVTLDIAPGADVQLDVTDAEAVRDAAGRIGPVDILINSAGVIGPNRLLWEIADHEWARTMAVNVTGTFNLCRAFVPRMREKGWGRIVNMASMAGKDGNPELSAYSASKAAVIALTKSLGKELATTGVLVNAVAPAVIETPMLATTSPEVLAHLTSLIPMRRLGRGGGVPKRGAWLPWDRCSSPPGAVYDISGGRATYCRVARPRATGRGRSWLAASVVDDDLPGDVPLPRGGRGVVDVTQLQPRGDHALGVRAASPPQAEQPGVVAPDVGRAVERA